MKIIIDLVTRTLLILIIVFLFFSCRESGGFLLEDRREQYPETITGYVVPNDSIEPPIVSTLSEPTIQSFNQPIKHPKKVKSIPIEYQEKAIIPSSKKISVDPSSSLYPKTTHISSIPKPIGKIKTYDAFSNKGIIKGRAEQFTTEQGIPTIGNNAIRKNPDGAIWGGSRGGGAWRFDGYKFEHFNKESGLLDNSVVDLFIDSDEEVWFGMSTGVAKYDGTELTHYIGKDEISQSKPTKFTEDQFGNIWIGSNDGLYKLDKIENTITHFSKENGLIQDEVNGLLTDRSGRIWIAYNHKGLSLLTIEKRETYHYLFNNYEVSAYLHMTDVQSLFQNSKGDVFLGTYSEVLQFKPDRNNPKSLEVHLYSNLDLKTDYNNGIAEDHLGRMWIGGSYNLVMLTLDQNGLFNSIQFFENEPGLISNSIYSFLIDDQNYMWLGHYFKGVTRMNLNDPVYSIRDDYGIYGRDTPLLKDRWGNIWFAIKGKGLFCLKKVENQSDEVLIEYKLNPKGVEPSYQDIIIDNENNIWATWAGTLVKINLFNQGDSIVINSYDNKQLNQISISNDLMKDNQGRIWMTHNTLSVNDKSMISTGGGVTMIDGKKLYFYGIEQGLLSSDTYVMMQDNEGVIWINSLYYGITKHELPSAKNPLGRWVHFEGNNVVSKDASSFVLHPFKGICLIDIEQFIHLIPTDDFSVLRIKEYKGKRKIGRANLTSNFIEDSEGNLWFGLENGLGRLKTKKTSSFDYDDTLIDTYFEEENEADGLIYDLLEGDSNRIWMSTPTGIKAFNPNYYTEHNKKASQFKCEFSQVQLFDQFYDVNDISPNPRFLHQENYIGFAYNVIEVNKPQKVEYRQQMVGLETSWRPASKATTSYYPNLPHGKYEFMVSARINQNSWSKSAVFPFVIMPPWNKTWWFYALCILGASALIYSIFQYRLGQLLKLERLRTKISSDLHDDLGSILSGLAMQAELLARNAKETNKPMINKITTTSRKAVHRMRDLVWSIDARKDRLSDLFDKMKETAEDLLIPKNIQFEFGIEGFTNTRNKLSVDIRQNLFFIFKEAIHNIVKHSNGDLVAIKITNLSNEITISIFDNGQTLNNELNKDLVKKGTGQGLSNMAMRAKQLKGSLEILKTNGFEVKVTISKNHIFM